MINQSIYIGILYRNRYSISLNEDCTKKCFEVMVFSLLYPHLIYCNIIWGSASDTLLQALFIQQKRALRILAGCHYRNHTNQYFNSMHLLKLSGIILYQTLQFVYRSINGLLPNSCLMLNRYIAPKKQYSTRHTDYFLIPYSRTNYRKNSVIIRSLRSWNQLPLSLQTIPSLSVFKRCLSAHLIDNYVWIINS